MNWGETCRLGSVSNAPGWICGSRTTTRCTKVCWSSRSGELPAMALAGCRTFAAEEVAMSVKGAAVEKDQFFRCILIECQSMHSLK